MTSYFKNTPGNAMKRTDMLNQLFVVRGDTFYFDKKKKVNVPDVTNATMYVVARTPEEAVERTKDFCYNPVFSGLSPQKLSSDWN
jgi:hypothetical protein